MNRAFSPDQFAVHKTRGDASDWYDIGPLALESYSPPLPPLAEQTRIVAELDAEAARIEAVRGLVPLFESKIARVLTRVWGSAPGQ
jgi:hypothetical protein